MQNLAVASIPYRLIPSGPTDTLHFMSKRAPSLCHLCNEIKPLIEAHIIPKAMLKSIQVAPGKPLFILQDRDGARPKSSPQGEYDTDILCKPCDAYIGDYDNYGMSFIKDLDRVGLPFHYPNGNHRGLVVVKYDYTKLKLFFLSVLWRASISTRPFFRSINLGAYENELRDMIAQGNPGAPDQYPILLRRFVGVNPGFTVSEPASFGDTNGPHRCRLYLVGCIADIMIGKQPITREYLGMTLGVGPSLVILNRDFNNTQEATQTDRVVKRLLDAGSTKSRQK